MRALVLTVAVIAGAAFSSPSAAQPARSTFRFAEATIADVQSALRQRRVTCRAVVAGYLARIDEYDKRGPALNAIVLTNPDALAVADSLDRRFAASRAFIGPLHCIPVIVKDNFQTAGLQTTAGTLALRSWIPRDDATMVKRLKDAGAIVLAKSNMAELAFSPYETVSSILPGYTKNPYALDRVTAGSSGGTGAAVAASFGVVGLGTDTGNSIRGPSAHNALVGIRSTMGLTSRDGVVPLNLASDIAGPMARTVTDAVAVFQIVAGYDPNDAVTEAARTRTIPDYAKALKRDGLKGARIGVLPQAYLTATTDTEVVRVFTRAVAELRRGGATVLDSVVIPELDSLRRSAGGGCNPFKYDLERFLASRNDTTFPSDFDIFSPVNSSIPLCIQRRANSRPAPRDWAISFSWCGKTRSRPPPWISKTGPRYFSAIAEHSMCQPGRPRPQGESHDVSSPSFVAFQSAKSRGSSLRGFGSCSST